MTLSSSRREFLAASAALAASLGLRQRALAELVPDRRQASLAPPIVITGGLKPLLEGNTARPLRYTPEANDFVIRNGSELFNRPIYGPVSDFRVDAGDLPEFSLYLPGHGGNLKLGIASGASSKWLSAADGVVARFRPGRMMYEIEDALLAGGLLKLELLTAASGSGLLLKVDAGKIPAGVSLIWAFAGASGRKGRRNGDIGCEIEPVSQFFRVRREECNSNRYTLNDRDSEAGLTSDFCALRFWFPAGTRLSVADFAAWEAVAPVIRANDRATLEPVLLASTHLGDEPLFLAMERIERGVKAGTDGSNGARSSPMRDRFSARSLQVETIAGSMKIDSPDPYLNPLGSTLSIVADALWDPVEECVMHGCVAWRVALAGWRGPYVLDATGRHDRARQQVRHWVARQNTAPIETGDPASGRADPNTLLARKEHLLHSNGDISGNHYDMNLVFFDVFARHLRWTGDIEFAREIWPSYKRHLAWERRLFRRTFRSATGKELPLYEAYAAIWASDNLQYNGGGTAHGSAYNLFSLREAAKLAQLLEEDPEPYRLEAALIQTAMEELLWLPAQGAYAEAKDMLGAKTVYHNPALWTVYHTIDSEVATPRQAWQMAAERLAALRHVPVHGEGVPDGGFLLSCSDWLPYVWSLNLLVLAENMHFALALWQAGMTDEAYALFRGNLLDSMYQGLCPGNFHMTSELDVHRQEAQRDFGDPTGITSRALVEGLFGVRPNLLEGWIDLRPGFPKEWNHASLHHSDFDLFWNRRSDSESYRFVNRFPASATFRFSLPARTTQLPHLTCNEEVIQCSFALDAVGTPRILAEIPASADTRIEMRWRGEPPLRVPELRSYRIGDRVHLPRGVTHAQIDDPQGCLNNGAVVLEGFHTVFAKVRHDACTFSLPISFHAAPQHPAFVPVPTAKLAAACEPLDLSPLLKHQIKDIFRRGYTEPRSALCSLSIPENLLGGWANLEFNPPKIDDAGLRAAGGMLETPLNVSFRTPPGDAPNCVFLSRFQQDACTLRHPLAGRASGIYLLVAGSTLPQCSRMQHALFAVEYSDGSRSTLSLRNPETWWPIEQDYLLDDYMFVNHAPLPPRVDLSSGRTRVLDEATFQGSGRRVPGGAATILHVALDPDKTLSAMTLEVELYGIVVALLAATLVRP